MDELDVLIDQKIVIVTLMHLYAQKSNGHLVKRLEKKLDGKHVINHVIGFYDRTLKDYTITVYKNILSVVTQWKKENYGVEYYIGYRFDHPAEIFARSFIYPVLETMASPSTLLGRLQAKKEYDVDEILEVTRILNHLIPYLASTGQLERLRIYKEDLEILKNIFTPMVEKFGWSEERMNNMLYIDILKYLSLEEMQYLIPDKWIVSLESVHLYLQSYHSDTFKYIAKTLNYTNINLSYAFISMEPDEWIDWYESLPPHIEPSNLIKITITEAYDYGYSYFVNEITRYAAKERTWPKIIHQNQ